jgi:hypothetical protein
LVAALTAPPSPSLWSVAFLLKGTEWGCRSHTIARVWQWPPHRTHLTHTPCRAGPQVSCGCRFS